MRSLLTITAIVLFALVMAPSSSLADGHNHGHEGDFIVGRSLAGKLMFESPELDHVIVLPASSSPFLAGWLDDHPGFDALGTDEPGEDFYKLAAGAQIYLEALSIDTGLVVWTSTLSGWIEEAGDRILLGGSSVHTHPVWHLDSDILGTDWEGQLSGTFRLIDLGTTGYSASDPFTITFANVEPIPEPATLALLGLGGLALAGRSLRRRARRA